jgi:drug/metabolite transporter (DMT)-like permease
MDKLIMQSNKYSLGIIFSLLAALANASIGIFTTFGVSYNLTPDKIAFYRCIIALAGTSLCLIMLRRGLRISFREFSQISLGALLGIFTLYFYETLSYQYTTINNVTFILMGSSAIFTFMIGRVFLSETLTFFRLLGLLIILLGIFFMIYTERIQFKGWLGNIYAIMAGFGYSLFLLLTRKFMLKSSLSTLWYFFLTGSLYLYIPCFIKNDFYLPLAGIPSLLVLGIIPTLGGFYFTTKALSYIEASRTQLFEISEPIFASLMAFLILQQAISFLQVLGGLLIIFGLFVSERQSYAS